MGPAPKFLPILDAYPLVFCAPHHYNMKKHEEAKGMLFTATEKLASSFVPCVTVSIFVN